MYGGSKAVNVYLDGKQVFSECIDIISDGIGKRQSQLAW